MPKPPPKNPAAAARKRRFYARHKSDPRWKRTHNRKSREGMQKLCERRGWLRLDRRGGITGVAGYTVVHAGELQRPLLKYLDARGILRTEEELSAEQLIASWREKEQKKNA